MELIKLVSGLLWDYILLFLLLGVGVYLTFLLKFPQFSRVFPAITKLVKDIKDKKEVEEGRMTPFQSLATAVAAQVGTGNIVGVATALAAGGPGAAFWMILSAFFGMSTIFAEAVLAQVYRHQTESGELVGGPAYYIKDGVNSKLLSKLFAIFTVIAMGIVGIMVQSNSVVGSLSEAFKIPGPWITAGLLAVVGIILTGGMERIAGFSEKVVPVMAFIYVAGAFIIIIMKIDVFLIALKMIITSAFNPAAISGGVLGIGLKETVRFGIARGLFSNEAGMGSTPHSHAVAHTDHPAEQGFIAMIGVFISTFLICTSTVMVNVVTGAYNPNIPASQMSAEATVMTQSAFTNGFGFFGGIFLAVSLSSFALTTIVGWYFFAESNIKLLFNDRRQAVIAFKIISLSFLVVGTVINPETIWSLSDLFTGLMALPNIIALILLAKEAKWILDDYDQKNKLGRLSWPTRGQLPKRKK